MKEDKLEELLNNLDDVFIPVKLSHLYRSKLSHPYRSKVSHS